MIRNLEIWDVPGKNVWRFFNKAASQFSLDAFGKRKVLDIPEKIVGVTFSQDDGHFKPVAFIKKRKVLDILDKRLRVAFSQDAGYFKPVAFIGNFQSLDILGKRAWEFSSKKTG